jgi:hypothetical protein
MSDVKTVDETFEISRKRGNGKLRREIWIDSETGEVTRYNLAHINHQIYGEDNGRVIGYDNAHDGHHKHRMGVVTPIEFTSFEEVERMFEQEWIAFKE